MGLFAALDGISPWWWVALAILLAAAEMVTVTTVLISAAAAALATAIGLWILPGLGGAGQIAIFGLLSILFTFAGRALVARYGDLASQGSGTLNRRAATLIGREAVVTQFAAETGQVTIDGMPWPARLDEGIAPPASGDRVRVVAADGIVVWIRPL
ncbi:MAG: NfeD family protein [Amaricoccus sp.]|mgnify:CR=1 FL=1